MGSVEIKIGDTDTGGVYGFVSWDRLKDVMKKAGEISADERVVGLKATSHGIDYKIEVVKDEQV